MPRKTRNLIMRFAAAIFAFSLASQAFAQGSERADLEARSKALYEAGNYREAAEAQRKALALALSEFGPQRAETAASLYEMGRRLSALAQYDEAEKFHVQALAIRERVLGATHADVGSSLNRIGALHVARGRIAEAAAALAKALTILEKTSGKGMIELAATLDNLAWLSEGQGRLDAAEAFYRRAVAITEQALGANHPETATRLSNYSGVKLSAGHYAAAADLLVRALAIREGALRPDHPDIAESLHNLALIEVSLGRLPQAEPRYKRAIEIWRVSVGEKHPLFGTALTNLGALYVAQGRLGEAEAVYRQALAVREAALGREHREVGATVNNLALLYLTLARFREAEPLLRRALAINEKALGAAHPDVAMVLNNIGNLYVAQARYADAEPFYQRALTIKEKALGPAAPAIASGVQNLAIVYHRLGRAGEAEPLYRRALSAAEKSLGPQHPDVATILQNLGGLLEEQGRYSEAETAAKRSLAIREKTLGFEHPDIAENLNNLSKLYYAQGRFDEGGAFEDRATAIWTKAFGPQHPLVGRALHNKAGRFTAGRQYAEAERLYKRALAIREKALEADHPEVADTLNNLAGVYAISGDAKRAEPLLRRVLTIRETRLGDQHPEVATTLGNLSDMLQNTGRFVEAEALQKRVLSMRVAALGANHPLTAMTSANLGMIYARTDRAALGLAQARDAARRFARSASVDAARLAEAAQTKAPLGELVLGFYLLTLRQAADVGIEAEQKAAAEGFEMAQFALQSASAAALAQMALRANAKDPALAVAVRRRQDSIAAWRQFDAQMQAAIALPAASRDAEAEAVWRAKLDEITAAIAAIDGELRAAFPDFAAMTNPAPLTAAEARGLLRPDEALVQIFAGPVESYIWVAAEGRIQFQRLNMSREAIADAVDALRCGLDFTAWNEDGEKRCQTLLNSGFSRAQAEAGEALPFDLERAHALYRALFGAFEREIKDKHLIIAPSGALTKLPFGVLVAQPPSSSGDYARAAWLGARQPLSILPGAASLRALRRQAPRRAEAPKPYIGFGNPLLTGADGRDRRAFGAQTCAAAAGLGAAKRSAAPPPSPLLAQNGPFDLNLLRAQAPLPETAYELCTVADGLRGSPEDVLLGARATETALKALDAQGRLAGYGTLHFATHGLIAGEMAGVGEPALVMTPPAAASAGDDGLFTASEAALLKLNADWVIMSACNTAAGGAQGAEALSGLARAFFYAGARALLVSHWAVDSQAAVKLTTGAVAAYASSATMGRAEAMRRAIGAVLADGTAAERHPAYWAPFVLAGEGGR